MTLENDILAWDGRDAAAMRAVYQRHCADAGFAATLVGGLTNEALQKGASWLLKHHLERGGRLDEAQIGRIYHTLPRLRHWETKLHILQSIEHMPIEATLAPQLHQYLIDCLAANKTFVRAWAYSGLYHLARQHARYRAEAGQLLDNALNNEAASVRARVRNLISRGF